MSKLSNGTKKHISKPRETTHLILKNYLPSSFFFVIRSIIVRQRFLDNFFLQLQEFYLFFSTVICTSMKNQLLNPNPNTYGIGTVKIQFPDINQFPNNQHICLLIAN
jgi:hypothetical protein